MSLMADPAPRAWTGPDAIVVIRQKSPEGAPRIAPPWPERNDRPVPSQNAIGPLSAAQRAFMALEGSACGVNTKRVACRTPSPSGVGTEIRNGTIVRVPAIGASHISMPRSALR